ncbi:MAG: antitermination protein NusG [Acidimicrobiia bacterium]
MGSGVLADVLIIISRNGGAFVGRWLHVVVGITWIGLLYYFNFVQVPSFAEMEAAARNNATDKLASRALWWFRWAAVATVVTGLLILLFQRYSSNDPQLIDGDYWRSVQGMAIATGILFALIMFVNVWGVIWRNQKVVIANARNVQAGGEADPNAAACGRKALLASRQNTIFSFTMLMFMVGAAHFFGGVGDWELAPSGGTRAGYWVVILIIAALFELNALGVIGGTGPGGTNWIYDHHKNALITSGVLIVVVYLVFYVFLKA